MAKKNKSSGALALNRTNKKSFIQKYNERETKGNALNTGIKTLADVILGATLGAGIGAVTGQQARFVGLTMIGIGHFAGDKSGILRVAGASAIAYGIAKYFENQTLAGTVNGVTLAGESSKAKTRLIAFKDEALATFYLDKVFKKSTDSTTDATSSTASMSVDATTSTGSSVGSIDLSALDFFDNFNHQEAQDFHAQLNASPDYLDDDSDDYSVNDAPAGNETEFAYAIIDQDPDFSKM